jgi:hypothetical protein
MRKRVGRRAPISDQRQDLTAQQSINFRRPALNLQHPASISATHALREFWARAPADALGVKQEFEKALAQDGKLTK